MKKATILLLIVAVTLLAMGQIRFWAGRRYRILRTVTTTEDTQLTASTQQTAPDYASDDGTVRLTGDGGSVGAIAVRFIGTAAADKTLSWTLWAWKSELDPARYVANGTATLGLTQTGNTNEFYADTIDITAQEWFTSLSVSDGAPSSIISDAGIAELLFDSCEYAYWKVVIRDIAGGGSEAATAGAEITTHISGTGSSGDSTTSGALLSSQIAWTVVDATTAADTEPDDLAVDERTYATVLAAIAAASAGAGDEEISYTSIPSTWNALRFRCIGATDNGAVTYQIYLGTLGGDADCELAKAGQLAFVIGTQASITSGYELADQVTVTAADWTKSWGSASPGDTSEQCAEAAIDIMGADFLVVVPSATDTDCKLLVKGY